MKREIIQAKPQAPGWCCPGHDDYPNETYRNRRSKKARARDKKKEHQHARSVLNRNLKTELSRSPDLL